MARFVCAADLHFGKGPDLDLSPIERLHEQEQVWEQILTIAHNVEADGILVAGDIFEGPIPTPEHYAAFARPLAKTDIPVVAITGNGRHDAAVRYTTAPEVLTAFLDDPHVFQVIAGPAQVNLAGVTICCLPWTPVSRLVAMAGGGDRDSIHEQAAELLVNIAQGLREKADGPAILLAHWSVAGATLPQGLPADQLRETVLPLHPLEYAGFDAVVLGHLHKPQTLSVTPDEPNIPVFYCGSPMALDFGEAQTKHGCWVLTVPVVHAIEDAADHLALSAEFVPLQSRRLVTLDYGPDELDQLWLDAATDTVGVHSAVVKVRVRARDDQLPLALTAGEIRAAFESQGAHKVTDVHIDVDRQRRQRVEGLTEDDGPLEALQAYLAAQGVNGTVGAALIYRTRRYLETTA